MDLGVLSRRRADEDVDVEGGFVAGSVDVGAAGLVFGDGAFDDSGAYPLGAWRVGGWPERVGR
jgi:hypothetical protein